MIANVEDSSIFQPVSSHATGRIFNLLKYSFPSLFNVIPTFFVCLFRVKFKRGWVTVVAWLWGRLYGWFIEEEKFVGNVTSWL